MLSPTLKTLSLRKIEEVPITFFLHIVHLTTLELHFISPDEFVYENSSSLTQAASKGMSPMASHAVIDRCLWNIFEDSEEDVRGTRFPSSAYFSLI